MNAATTENANVYCYICDHSMETNDKLKIHVYAHKDDDFFECPDCAEVIFNIDIFQDHVQQHTAGFENESAISQSYSHIKSNDSDEKKVGNVCNVRQMGVDYSSSNENNIKPILAGNDQNDKASRETIKKHMECSLDTNIPPTSKHRYKCCTNVKQKFTINSILDEAETIFSNEELRTENVPDKDSNYTQHIDIPSLVGKKLIESRSDKMTKDPICSKINRDDPLNCDNKTKCCLNYGENSKNFQCNICGLFFIQNYLLRNHLERHAHTKDFQCEYCGRDFSSTNGLKMHIRTHTGEKPYECYVCNKYFRRSSNLGDHLKTHRSSKEVCYVCGHLFASYDTLRKHLRLHYEEKSFKCEICERCFRQKKHLDNHFSVHTKERKFVCYACGKRFTRKDVLEAHKKHRCKETLLDLVSN